MSFTLAELETTVTQLPYASNAAWGTPNSPVVHRACRWACDTFMRTTRCSITRQVFTIPDASASINIKATYTTFDPSRLLIAPWLTASNNVISRYDHSIITARRNAGTTTGKPYMIAFVEAIRAEIFPTSDAAYEMGLIWWEPTSFTPGATGSGVTIDIPSEYLGDVAFGALGYLMMEFPERKSGQSMALFENAIKEARGIFAAQEVALIERYGGMDSSREERWV